MTTALAAPAAPSMPDDGHFARNLIGGRWQFPAAPYEYEIRNPADSTITAVVPLSSRFDVARAFTAGERAGRGPWAVPGERDRLLHDLLDRLDTGRAELAHLQSVETGLSAADSLDAVDVTLAAARALADGGAQADPAGPAGVSGHVLSWGLPFTEIVTSVLPAFLRGDAVIVKPSLRGPLSAVAFAYLAAAAGLPGGVLNVVQGTGVDIGAELISRRGLSALYVRAGRRTLSLAERAGARTSVPLRTLRAGGNAVIVGPHDVDAAALAGTITDAVRMNSAGGPFGPPLLAVHSAQAEPVLAAVLARLRRTVPAPLPTEPLRRQALQRIEAIIEAGAEVLLGGIALPDDVAHRMGWLMPPTVLMLGAANSGAVRAEQATEPLGPVLSVLTWRERDDLAEVFSATRARDGVARLWGLDVPFTRPLPHGLVTAGSPASSGRDGLTLPPAWYGGRS